MKLLALDSSALVASVAIATEEKVLAEYTVNFKKTHSQTLLPMLDELVKLTELSLEEVDAIAVAGGPGSFTGLRIGAATAKGLGLALDRPVIPVPTLEGMAFQLYGSDKLICPMMDARRNQVYAGAYEFIKKEEGIEVSPEGVSLCTASPTGDGIMVSPEGASFRMNCVLEQSALGIGELLEKLKEQGREVVFLGDGVPVQKEYIRKNCPVPFSFAPPHLAYQSAGALAMRAFELYRDGKAEPAADFKPVYLRASQAERERNLRMEERAAMLANPESRQEETQVMYRRMEKMDVEAVADIEAECFSEPWSRKQIAEAMERPEYLYAVAEKEGNVVGYCAILQVAGEGQITNVAVTGKCRGLHIGRELVKRAISFSRKKGNQEFTLEVRKGNEAAIALYHSLGFTEDGIRKDFYRKPVEDALLMRLKAE